MKTSHRLVVGFIVLTLCHCCYAQIASPSVAPSPAAQTSPTPCPPTSIKVSTTGLELSGFPTWIIWVFLAAAIVGVLFSTIMFKADAEKFATPLVVAILLICILVLGMTFSFGSWWGHRAARNELQELIAARAASTVEVPLPAAASVSQSWPFYMVVMGFSLFAGFEIALFMYIYLRWGWRHWRRHWDPINRPSNFEDYIISRLDRIESRLRS